MCKAARGGHRQARVVGRPVCKPPAERGARAPVCKAARGGHRQVQGCARRAPVRRGLWPGACGVLAAGARARRAARAGCVPRSREAAGRAITQSKAMERLEHHDAVKEVRMMPKEIAWRGLCHPCWPCGQPFEFIMMWCAFRSSDRRSSDRDDKCWSAPGTRPSDRVDEAKSRLRFAGVGRIGLQERTRRRGWGD